MNILKICNFEITDLCNYDCEFCLKDFRQNLVGNISQKQLNWIKSLDCEAYVITGGEPSLNKKAIFDFIDNNKIIILNTNLSNFSIDEILMLNGKVTFHIDFPSIIKAEYLKITKCKINHYNNVINNLKVIKNAQITIVVTETNKNSFIHTIKVLASVYNITEFCVSPAISKNIPSAVEIFKALDNFAFMHRNLHIYTLSYTRVYEMANCKYIKPTHACTAGLNRFIVKANGEIVNCAWYNEKIIGHVGDDLTNLTNTFKCSKYCLGDKC